MKISVLVPGRLHGFDMAIYFQNIGVLNQLVTGYPMRYVLPFGIKKQYIKSLYINEIINRTTNFIGIGYPLDFLACEAFDFLASKVIKYDSDVYFIWSSYGEKTIRKIRAKNPIAKIILVRGSTHINTHESLLRQVNNTSKQQINIRIVEKELKEYQLADYISVPSTFAMESFISCGIRKEKLFLNLLGVSLEQFPFFEKRIPEKAITFGNVGTLSKQKNVEDVINVIKKLNKKTPIYKLVLAGPIEESTFDKNLLNEEFITYFGKVDQSQLYQVYQKIDVFVINSVQEGMAMVQLQAMSSGCPLISTRNSGGADLIKGFENGILISAMDNIALENAINWFSKNKDKITQMGRYSRGITEDGFTWDDFGKRNVEFIKQILIENSSSGL
ncbi:glycosyltransferase family 4 protein [Pedobacter sp. Leaf250]|uniref:glycosyltransferase family 4 protein n=1 Tax=Pedobacter sp. Leaf250 TaxID=2876559 RepID=UPI001E605482|nr:glycosyltransferase family 4 protein [Pedobacter sp. Leaf250]